MTSCGPCSLLPLLLSLVLQWNTTVALTRAHTPTNTHTHTLKTPLQRHTPVCVKKKQFPNHCVDSIFVEHIANEVFCRALCEEPHGTDNETGV